MDSTIRNLQLACRMVHAESLFDFVKNVLGLACD